MVKVLTCAVDFVPFYALGNVCIGSTLNMPMDSTSRILVLIGPCSLDVLLEPKPP